eukprot:g1034.t1
MFSSTSGLHENGGSNKTQWNESVTNLDFDATTSSEVVPDFPTDTENITSLSPTSDPSSMENSTTVIETIIEPVNHVGYWPSDYLLSFIANVHDFTGLEWWASIVMATVVVRGAMVPLFINSQINAKRMAAMKPDMEVLRAKLASVQNEPDPKKKSALGTQYHGELQALYKKHGASPIRSLVPLLVQLPVFTSFFFALQRINDVYPVSMSTGGIGYLTDLTAKDPYYLMPVLISGSFLAISELTLLQQKGTAGEMSGNMQWVMRGMGLFMLPVAVQMPASVLFYFFSTNVISLVQTFVLGLPGVKSLVGIPEDTPAPLSPAKKQFVDRVSEQKKVTDKHL